MTSPKERTSTRSSQSDERPFTVNAFAKWAGVDPKTVYRWIWAGQIKAFALPSSSPDSKRKSWRIPASECARFEQGAA